MRNLCWKWTNFGVLSPGFDVKALIPQGLTRRPNYCGLLNDLMILIICERLREIGEMACITYAWSSRGQTLKCLGRKRLDVCLAQLRFFGPVIRAFFYRQYFIFWMRNTCLHVVNLPSSSSFREFKKTTTATATATSQNKRLNEQNNGSARAL